jgi:aspartate racemase
MKTIGLIGGMSWESSRVYYELLNEKVREELGGFHSCKCILVSVDFAEVEHWQRTENWLKLDNMMAKAAMQLEEAGSDIILLCTNTMHRCSPAITSRIKVPFLHIAKATGEDILLKGLRRMSLLGTRYTMENNFYASYLEDHFGIEVLVPDASDRSVVHNIIYKELVLGKFKESSRRMLQDIIARQKQIGAQGVILGCTELPMLVSEKDAPLPMFDTTKIHAEKAVAWALQDSVGRSAGTID